MLNMFFSDLMANPPNFDEGSDRGNFSGMVNGYTFGMINQHQLDWLMRNMSTEDMNEFRQMTGQCARKCAVTCGGPIAALTIGFLEFMRRRQNLSIKSPRYLVGYPIMVLTSVLLGSTVGFKRSACGAQTRLFLNNLYAKYDSQIGAGNAQMAPGGGGGGTSPAKTFAQLREANRAGRLIEAEQLKQQQQRQQPQQRRQFQQQKMDGVKQTTDGTESGGMSSSSDDWGRFGLDGMFVPSSPNSSADGTSSASSPSPPKPF